MTEERTQASDTAMIERLAREAGLDVYADNLRCYETNTAQMSVAARFAALVAEECEAIARQGFNRADTGDEIADAIRARFCGETSATTPDAA